MSVHVKDGERPVTPETEARHGEWVEPNGSTKTLERSDQGLNGGGIKTLDDTQPAKKTEKSERGVLDDPAPSSTRSDGRSTATRYSSFMVRPCCSFCSATLACRVVVSTHSAGIPISRAPPTWAPGTCCPVT